MRNEPCHLCGSTRSKTVLEIDQPDRFERAMGITVEGYRRYWVECRGCGLLINVFDRRDISEIYARAYYSKEVEKETVSERFQRILALPPEKSDNYYRIVRIRKVVGEFFEEYGTLADPKRPRKVLDIGSGTGIFLYRFLEALPDWQAVAVEPNNAACAHLRSLKRFSVIQGCFRSELVEGSFDLVTLNKLVEHVKKPVQLLRDVHPCLSGDGIVYVEVPDKITVWRRKPTDNILGSLHYFLFDPVTLGLLFQKSQFVPIMIQRYVEPSGKITVSGFGVTEECFGRICSQS